MDSTSPQLSIIICSLDAERFARCAENFAATAGVPVEFIRIDNREHGWPIARAYNEGARRAKAPNLMFIHEDVLFENSGWGADITAKLSEKDCGVIGFVGSTFRIDALSGWCQRDNGYYGRLIFVADGCRYAFFREPWVEGDMAPRSAFAPVVVVDGLAMAVRKDIWAEMPFDEKWLTGFHCYDIDFCLQVGSRYRNYAYLRADVCHYSNGSYNERWLDTTLTLSEERWSRLLPRFTEEISDEEVRNVREGNDYDFTRRFLRKGYPKPLARRLLRHFLRDGVLSHDLKHTFTVCWQYFIKYVLK